MMIAVVIHSDVVLAGIRIPAHRTLEVLEEVEAEEDRSVLTTAEARVLVDAGYAEPVEANFERIGDLIDGWQRPRA